VLDSSNSHWPLTVKDRFDPRPVHVGDVETKWHWELLFYEYLGFPFNNNQPIQHTGRVSR